MATSMCWSPIPCRMVWRVAFSLYHDRVISSSHRRVSEGLIFAASAWVLGPIATRYSADGYSGTGIDSGWPLSQKVSPVAVTESFATEAISPQCTLLTAICSLPRWMCRPAMRSSSPLFWFQTRASACMEPENIRKYVIFPTNGSAVVFQIYAASGLESEAVSSSSPSFPWAVRAGASAGDGAISTMAFNHGPMPISRPPAAQKTGTKSPETTTFFKPRISSSLVSSPLSRYFSSRASSPSAAASINSM